MKGAVCLPTLRIDPRKCHGCCSCIVVCPVTEEIRPEARYGNDPYHPDLVILVRNGVAKINNLRRCTFCGECVAACPGLAITIENS